MARPIPPNGIKNSKLLEDANVNDLKARLAKMTGASSNAKGYTPPKPGALSIKSTPVKPNPGMPNTGGFTGKGVPTQKSVFSARPTKSMKNKPIPALTDPAKAALLRRLKGMK